MQAVMRSLSTILTILIAAGVASASDQPGPAALAAVLYHGRLLCLYEGGAVAAWDAKTGAYAKEAGPRLTRKGLAGLAADGDTLWAADGAAVYRWSPRSRGWEKVA